MRKFMPFPARTLRFRLLLILAGALMLLAVLAPRANATLIHFYDFEGTDTPPYHVGLQSNIPAADTAIATTMFLDNGTPGVVYPVGNTSQEAGIALNLPPGAGPNLTALGIHRSGTSNLGLEIPMPSAQGIYDVTSVSFAYDANGNGHSSVQLNMSTNGGISFSTNLSGLIALPATPGTVTTMMVPSGTTLTINNLDPRSLFTGAQSNGNDLQLGLDNIQINGTIVPEPATVASGLLGVVGLCWFQRKRLIRSVRFRRT